MRSMTRKEGGGSSRTNSVKIGLQKTTVEEDYKHKVLEIFIHDIFRNSGKRLNNQQRRRKRKLQAAAHMKQNKLIE